jgi:hypothetical protein
MSVANLIVGGINDTSTADIADTWAGYIDEVCVWDSALVVAEIVALYNGGVGLAPSEDSGNYVSSDDLIGWWRMGDGGAENAGSVPTVNITDESGNGHDATYESDTPDAAGFYRSIALFGGVGNCAGFDSSSSIYPRAGPQLFIRRADQDTSAVRTGFEGDLKRMVVNATASEASVPTKIFVYELARTTIGLPIRRPVFRRVATLNDLQTLPEDVPDVKLPRAYLSNQAEVLAETTALLDAAWLEVQRQAATLALDIREFGIPDADGVLRGGLGEAATINIQTFELQGTAAGLLRSSSSSRFIRPPSSSSVSPIPGPTSSSSKWIRPSSSSSWWVDPHAFSDNIEIVSEGDAVTRLDEDGTKTLFTDLGFVRFGRDLNPLRTWDTFLRFPIDIPRCALIESCVLVLVPHTTETGQDVTVRVYDIYADGSFTPIGAFSGTDDPVKTHLSLVWSAVAQASTGVASISPPDLSDMLQFFVDRGVLHPGGRRHDPGDYFGLWIKEEASDDGARRDAQVVANARPYLRVIYRNDRECESSSYIGT